MQMPVHFRQTPIFILLVLSLFSCRVTLVPEYSAELEAQIAKTAKATDRLYIDLLDAKQEDRSYDQVQSRYNDIEAEINSIELQNQARIKNGDFLAIVKNLKEAFAEAKTYHKEHSTLSNGEIMSYQATLAGFWKPLYIAEKALNMESKKTKT
jgi:hypothetical protein